MRRSLKLRPDCIPTIKSTLLRNGFPSQRILAEHLEIAQSTVSSFLNGKPVDYLNFLELCRVLGQEWQDIADLEGQTSSETAAIARATVAIACQNITLNELLQSAPTESGIYSDHLRRHLGNLKHHPTLLEAFREVISSHSSVRFPSEQAFKLSRIGLVKLDKNEVTPRCHLYRQYFQGLYGRQKPSR
jgi:hypothetical protein